MSFGQVSPVSHSVKSVRAGIQSSRSVQSFGQVIQSGHSAQPFRPVMQSSHSVRAFRPVIWSSHSVSSFRPISPAANQLPPLSIPLRTMLYPCPARTAAAVRAPTNCTTRTIHSDLFITLHVKVHQNSVPFLTEQPQKRPNKIDVLMAQFNAV